MKKKNILHIVLLSTLTLSQVYAQENNETTSFIPTVTQVVSPPKVPSNDVIISLPSIPLVPVVASKAPKLIILDSSGKMIEKDSMDHYYPKKKEIIFSNHVAPLRFNVNQNQKKVEIVENLVGEIKDGRVPAYLHSALLSVDEVKAKLTSAGFNILSTFVVDKNNTATSIVFTNKDIIKGASQTSRGFAGALRLTIDTKNQLLSISNPIFIMKAFMQESYSQELATNTLKQLRDSFPDMKNSKEMIKFSILDKFQFMKNMPYYQDMKIVSQGTNEELLAKVKKSDKLVFEQVLDNGSILLGVHLGKRTRKFVKKIGFQNSGLLPYPVVIEEGKVYILDPQYYIAVMYPELKMSQFMTIATVPGAISKDIDRMFR